MRFDETTGDYIDVYAAESGAFTFGSDGNLYKSQGGGSANNDPPGQRNRVKRFGPASQAVFTVSLSSPSGVPVTVDFNTADGTALAGGDYEAVSGMLTFAPAKPPKRSSSDHRRQRLGGGTRLSRLIYRTRQEGRRLSTARVRPRSSAMIRSRCSPTALRAASGAASGSRTARTTGFRSTQRSTDGSYSAEVDGRATDATLTTAQAVDLTPYGSAELTFDWQIESGLDAGEYLALDLFDGSSWNEAARLSGNVDPENTCIANPSPSMAATSPTTSNSASGRR